MEQEGSIITLRQISAAAFKFESVDFNAQILSDEFKAEAAGIPFATAVGDRAPCRAYAVYCKQVWPIGCSEADRDCEARSSVYGTTPVSTQLKPCHSLLRVTLKMGSVIESRKALIG